MNGDAVFGAGGDGISRNADPFAGNGDAFEMEQGGLGEGFFLLGDFQPALVFANVAAELVGDEVLNDGHGFSL